MPAPFVDVRPNVFSHLELPYFEQWFACEYAPGKMPAYLERKVERDGGRWEEAGVLPPPP